MIKQEVRDFIAERNPSAIVFDNPSFDNSIIGLEESTDVVAYSLNKMIREFAEENDVEELEALEFIEYNTIRALPYAGEYKPIIIDDTCFEED